MKKLLFLFTALLFISCSSDENEESTQTFLEKYDGVGFINNDDEMVYFFNSDIYNTYVNISIDCINKCEYYKDIGSDELTCLNYDILQSTDNIQYCRIIKNDPSKLIDECIYCSEDDILETKYTYEYKVSNEVLTVTMQTENMNGTPVSEKIMLYTQVSTPLDCGCE
jgi:hypothetical protein